MYDGRSDPCERQEDKRLLSRDGTLSYWAYVTAMPDDIEKASADDDGDDAAVYLSRGRSRD